MNQIRCYNFLNDRKSSPPYYNEFVKYITNRDYTNKKYILQSVINLFELAQINKVCVIRNSTNVIDIKSFGTTGLKISSSPKFYDYDNYNNEWWINFANKYLGGGVFNKGFVQEEVIMIEFPEGMYVSYNERKAAMAKNESIILTNLIRSVRIKPNKELLECKDDKIRANFISVDSNNHSDEILSSDYFKSYDEDEIKNLILKLYSGFKYASSNGTKRVNGGRWGCGIFNNHPVMMFLIQILTANLSNLEEIKFWAVKEDDKELFLSIQLYKSILQSNIKSLDDLVKNIIFVWNKIR